MGTAATTDGVGTVVVDDRQVGDDRLNVTAPRRRSTGVTSLEWEAPVRLELIHGAGVARLGRNGEHAPGRIVDDVRAVVLHRPRQLQTGRRQAQRGQVDTRFFCWYGAH